MDNKKIKGTFPFASNYEVTKSDALDPRVRWNDWKELVVKSNWPTNDDVIYLYKGLIAAVGNDVWILIDDKKFSQALNTVGVTNTLYNVVNGEYVAKPIEEIAETLGWKIVGGDSSTVNEHTLILNRK